MKDDDNQQPETKPSGNMPPPRPPKRTAIGLGPDDDDENSPKRRPEGETVRINLPMKPSVAPKIRMPLLGTAVSGIAPSNRGKAMRNILRVGVLVFILMAFLVLAYAYQRPRFIQRVNATFDPKEKAFHGVFLPWPIGHPSMFGRIDPNAERRFGASFGYEFGTIRTNGTTLTVYQSDGSFYVRAN